VIRQTDLTGHFGSEIDIDLRSWHENIGELTDLFRNRQLLVFRNQQLSDQDHVRVAGHFGWPLYHSPEGGKVGCVSNEVPGATVPAGELLFHSDMAYSPEPVAGLSLYGLVVSPEQSVSTRFASSAHACAMLDDDLKRELRQRKALHVYGYTLDVSLRGAVRQRDVGAADLPLRAMHPVIAECPFGGAESLYVSDMQTYRIEGLDKAKSDALLHELFRLIYAESNTYEHHWQAGDLVIWNNIAVQHARGHVSAGAPRTLRRVAFAAHQETDPWSLMKSLDRALVSKQKTFR